jgi:glycosyltransferase involved in cell wall biosynthesis
MVFLLIRALSVGGAERQVVELANGLGRRGIAVGIVTLYDNGPLEQAVDGRHVRRFSLAKRGRWDMALPVLRLVRLIYRERPAILYAFLPAQTALAGFLYPVLPPCRLVFGLRSSLDYRRTDWLQRTVYALEARLARRAALVIANSEAGRQSAIARGIAPGRLVVIGNLIDTDHFAPDPERRGRQRAAWGIAATVPLIGMAARFDPMKGHGTFLQAASLLHRRLPAARFVLIGSGPADHAAALAASADRLGLGASLIWAGECRDMVAAYVALDLATLASDEGEGFPNAVAEAMACGVPVVATDTGDTAHLIGATGLVVRPRDPAALAEAWAALLAADPARLGAEARQRIAREFDLGAGLDHNLRTLTALVDSPSA